MNRNDAIDYLKALLGEDINLSPDSVSIERQDETKLSILRIKTKDTQLIKAVAKKRNLDVKEEGDSIVIFHRKALV